MCGSTQFGFVILCGEVEYVPTQAIGFNLSESYWGLWTTVHRENQNFFM
jgi:hypothetical protein